MPCSGTLQCHVQRHFLLPPHSSKVLDGDDYCKLVNTKQSGAKTHKNTSYLINRGSQVLCLQTTNNLYFTGKLALITMISGLIKLIISKDLLVLIFKGLLCCVFHTLSKFFSLWKVSWITLGLRITIFRPTERMPIHPKQRVLLLHAKPDVAVGDLVHYFLAAVAVIVF